MISAIEAGDNFKEAKKQKEADANMIWKWKWPASQEDEADARETNHKCKEVER